MLQIIFCIDKVFDGGSREFPIPDLFARAAAFKPSLYADFRSAADRAEEVFVCVEDEEEEDDDDDVEVDFDVNEAELDAEDEVADVTGFAV